MQPSNQQPSEEEQQPQAQSVAEKAEPVVAASEIIVLGEASSEEVQSGLVYPPPPSFYQNMQIPAEKPPLPLPAPDPIVPRSYPAANVGFAPQNAFQPHPGLPPQPLSYPPPTRPRGSRKKLWIILSIVGVCLLTVCGLCGWGIYSYVAPIFQNVSQSLTTVTNLTNDYYQNIEQKHYDAAYQDLQMNSLTQSAFAQQAQQRETQLGSISSFQIDSPSPEVTSSETGENISGYKLTIDVVRASSSYSVHLEVEAIGSTWKITSFDVI